MTTQFDFQKGVYRVTNAKGLNVRGTKDTSNNGNLIGQALTVGKEFPVYDIEIDAKGWVWGVVTPPGGPQNHYVCLWDLNTVFAVPTVNKPEATDTAIVTLNGTKYLVTLTKLG